MGNGYALRPNLAKKKVWLALGLLLSVCSLYPSTHGCAVFAGYDKDGHVIAIPLLPPAVIENEQAVIIWDEAHKIEHFIRQADISTTASNVGFLVPTPTTPELVEVDPLIFAISKEIAAPKKVPEMIYLTPFALVLHTLFPERRGLFKTINTVLATSLSDKPRGPQVQVLHEQDIAGYHAAILAANDITALHQWLNDNGYVWDKNAESWLEPYLKAQWKITAFKLNKSNSVEQSKPLVTQAIRMSFSTDRPFFPYSEPGDTAQGGIPHPGGRGLNVAFFGTKPVKGILEDKHAWTAELQYTGPIEEPYNAAQILAFAKLDKAADSFTIPTVLTYFADKSNPRPGTADLYFSSDPGQKPFHKTEIDYDLPTVYLLDYFSLTGAFQSLVIVALLGTTLFFLIRKFKRRNSTH